MINRIVFYVLFYSTLSLSLYAMETTELEEDTHKGQRVVQPTPREGAKDFAPKSLAPYEKFPPEELDQTLLELLVVPFSASSAPMIESTGNIVSDHVLYNDTWFGCKASDSKCAALATILQQYKKSVTGVPLKSTSSPLPSDESLGVCAILVPQSQDIRSVNTFSVEGANPESVLASYDIYVNGELQMDSEDTKRSLRFLLSVTKNKLPIVKKKTATVELTTSEKYMHSVSALFKEADWSGSEHLITITYSYPFFVSGKDLLGHILSLKSAYPDKVKAFVQHLAKEVVLCGTDNLRLDNDDLCAIEDFLGSKATSSSDSKDVPHPETSKFAQHVSKMELNSDNYVDVANLNIEAFGRALWERDLHCLRGLELKDMIKSQITKLAWYSTQTSRWVALQILTGQTSHAREQLFSKFLDIGISLLDANNVHGTMQVISALTMASVGRILEKPANKDKDKPERSLFEDPRWQRLKDVAFYPNADKHFNPSIPSRFLSFSAMAGRVVTWHEEFGLSEKGNIDILRGIAAVAKSFLNLQRSPFIHDPEAQYVKLVCGIGSCETGEIRAETLETISSLLKDYPPEEALDIPQVRKFEDLQDSYFCNFLRNKGCEKKVILDLYRKNIFSGHDLMEPMASKTPQKKLEKLLRLNIPESIAKGILHAHYAAVVEPKGYMPISTKEKEAKKTRKTSTSKSSSKK